MHHIPEIYQFGETGIRTGKGGSSRGGVTVGRQTTGNAGQQWVKNGTVPRSVPSADGRWWVKYAPRRLNRTDSQTYLRTGTIPRSTATYRAFSKVMAATVLVSGLVLILEQYLVPRTQTQPQGQSGTRKKTATQVEPEPSRRTRRETEEDEDEERLEECLGNTRWAERWKCYMAYGRGRYGGRGRYRGRYPRRTWGSSYRRGRRYGSRRPRYGR